MPHILPNGKLHFNKSDLLLEVHVHITPSECHLKELHKEHALRKDIGYRSNENSLEIFEKHFHTCPR